jgi:hypothetical protein
VVRLPREISAAAARRRSLLADFAAALVLAIVAIALSAGLGIVGALALITLLVVLIWIGIEAALRRLRRRRLTAAGRRPASSATPDRAARR